ncbi:type 2C protein phosphatase PTC6 [Sugiyamaella lignohabitans]|uniref:Type 2C protein phosphatase PTC6 n=1 Tax=Sugiyamaella lignohabitans TaxID=796027 RepID=A0A167C226_9ASCO|nr:type 2C protein phosphatase PTC6 [Sugiyamaella lignohabitans]ANB11125.1 type 2C protein phosphatase PTC6 [Sugiyamaella lignohabitans]
MLRRPRSYDPASIHPVPTNVPKLARSVSAYYTVESDNHSKARINLLKNPSYLGHYTSRVNRTYNEDRYYAGVLKLPVGSSLTSKYVRQKFTHHDRQVFNFAVFDGHGGSECSQFLQDHLAEYVENCDLSSGTALRDLYRKNVGGYWRAWGPELDRYVSRLTAVDDFQLRLPLSFLKADYEFSEKFERAGSTATSVYLYSDEESISANGDGTNLIGKTAAANDSEDAVDYSRTPKAFWDQDQVTTLVVAHVGDTRCILCDHHGNVHQLTTNHHPSTSVENTRLKRYATSFFTDSFGEERFGSFANTRAFGDFAAKAKGITAEPEIVECRIGDKRKIKSLSSTYPRHIKTFTGDEAFLVLMSDGVTEMISDQEVVDLVINTANKAGSGRGTPQDAAKEIVHYAAAVGGDDNATCMVIRLSGWGKWDTWYDRTAPRREEKLSSYSVRAPRRT